MAMRLFSRKQGHQPLTGGLAGKLTEAWLALQFRMSSWLNERTKSYSALRWRLLLAGFCLLAGGASIYLIISSIY